MNACPSAGGGRGFFAGVGWGFLAALPLWNSSTDVRAHCQAAAKLDGGRDGDEEWKHVSLRGLSSPYFSLFLSLSLPLVLLLVLTPRFHCGLVNFLAVPRLHPVAST